MTTLRNIAMTIGLTAVLGTATLFAQNASTANIPFDFQITGTTVPAGRYTVRLAHDHRMLVFQNEATGHSVMTLVMPSKSGTPETPKLIFRHNGERYTLDSAWFAGIQTSYATLPRKGDRADTERDALATVRLSSK